MQILVKLLTCFSWNFTIFSFNPICFRKKICAVNIKAISLIFFTILAIVGSWISIKGKLKKERPLILKNMGRSERVWQNQKSKLTSIYFFSCFAVQLFFENNFTGHIKYWKTTTTDVNFVSLRISSCAYSFFGKGII